MKNLPPFAADGDKRPVVATEAVAPETIEDVGVRACVDYWDATRGDAFAPRWTDFHLHELPARVLPYALVLDVVSDPAGFRYRYWGSGHTLYHGHDYTGKRVAEMADPWSSGLLTDQYNHIVRERRPIVFVNFYDGVDQPLYSLRMPLSEDGEAVTHLFSYVGRRPASESMRRVYAADRGG